MPASDPAPDAPAAESPDDYTRLVQARLDNPEMTVKEIASLCGVSVMKAKRQLGKAREAGELPVTTSAADGAAGASPSTKKPVRPGDERSDSLATQLQIVPYTHAGGSADLAAQTREQFSTFTVDFSTCFDQEQDLRKQQRREGRKADVLPSGKQPTRKMPITELAGEELVAEFLAGLNAETFEADELLTVGNALLWRSNELSGASQAYGFLCKRLFEVCAAGERAPRGSPAYKEAQKFAERYAHHGVVAIVFGATVTLCDFDQKMELENQAYDENLELAIRALVAVFVIAQTKEAKGQIGKGPEAGFEFLRHYLSDATANELRLQVYLHMGLMFERLEQPDFALSVLSMAQGIDGLRGNPSVVAGLNRLGPARERWGDTWTTSKTQTAAMLRCAGCMMNLQETLLSGDPAGADKFFGGEQTPPRARARKKS